VPSMSVTVALSPFDASTGPYVAMSSRSTTKKLRVALVERSSS